MGIIYQALGHLLPLAVAVALSTVPITITLLILLSERQRQSSVPFLIGWIFGIAILAVAFTLMARYFPVQPSRGPQATFDIAQIVTGVALVVLAVLLMIQPAPHRVHRSAKWLQSMPALGPWSAFGLALALNLRPKSLLLSLAAGLAVTAAPISVSGTVVALGVYTVVSALGVGVLVVYARAAPGRAEPRLTAAKDWLSRNSRIVSILILVLIGVFIAGNGLSRL